MLQLDQTEKSHGTNVGAIRLGCRKGIKKGKNEPNIESKNSKSNDKNRITSPTKPKKSIEREDGDRIQVFFKGLLKEPDWKSI